MRAYFPSSSKSWYSSVNLVQIVNAILIAKLGVLGDAFKVLTESPSSTPPDLSWTCKPKRRDSCKAKSHWQEHLARWCWGKRCRFYGFEPDRGFPVFCRIWGFVFTCGDLSQISRVVFGSFPYLSYVHPPARLVSARIRRRSAASPPAARQAPPLWEPPPQ